jgi:hypothetical protein
MHTSRRRLPGSRSLALRVFLLSALAAGCTAPSGGASGTSAPSASASTIATGVAGHVLAGPTCPVERPGDPACSPRPVANATLTVRSGDAVVATTTTDAGGAYRIALPPGDYTIESAPVGGLMGTPSPISFSVAGTALTPLDVTYDTGIR